MNMTLSATQHKPTLRVIKLLEAVASTSRGATLSEIAEIMECPRSTLTPILKTLVDCRYLVCDNETLRYSIGRQAYIIGNTYQYTGDVLDLIRDQMEVMASLCNENVHLGVLEGDSIIYLQKVTGSKPLRLISAVGKHLPAYATALGKSLLYDHTLKELHTLFPPLLPAITDKTLATVDDLYKNIHKDNNDEFTYEEEEITKYARCIAKPLRMNGKIVAALSISFIVFDGTAEHVEKIKQILRRFGTIIKKLIAAKGAPY